MKTRPEGTTADEIRAGESEEMNAAYRERMKMVAGHSYKWPTVLTPATDYPGMYVVYLCSPAGQISFHCMPEDTDLFQHENVRYRDVWEWDGHDTEEKWRRYFQAVRMEAGLESSGP